MGMNLKITAVVSNHGLTIEDEEITQELVEQLLKDNGYEVVYVTTESDDEQFGE